MDEIEFQPWPKIARLNRDIIVTEKIDGTNAAILILEDGRVAAQSRKRLITPEDDNYGFARWVSDNAGILTDTLGVGRHFGEWWGAGIPRRYGLTGDDKRFSLFNTHRFADVELGVVQGLATTPVLYQGPYAEFDQDWTKEALARNGSIASPGFMNPEGFIIFHVAAQEMFKVTLEGDEVPKSLAVAS